MLPAPHLAALAAEPIAAHGVVGQGALLAAVSPAPRTLLPGQQPESCPSAPGSPQNGGSSPLTLLTASEPQSHSSPASTKPLPHSGGSRSCRTEGETSHTHTHTRELLGTPEPAAAVSPRKGHHIPGERQPPQTAARHEAPAPLGDQHQHFGRGRGWGHHEGLGNPRPEPRSPL